MKIWVIETLTKRGCPFKRRAFHSAVLFEEYAIARARRLSTETGYKHRAVAFYEGDIEAALAQSPYDISPCGGCGLPVVCLPEGLAPLCVKCAKEQNHIPAAGNMVAGENP